MTLMFPRKILSGYVNQSSSPYACRVSHKSFINKVHKGTRNSSLFLDQSLSENRVSSLKLTVLILSKLH